MKDTVSYRFSPKKDLVEVNFVEVDMVMQGTDGNDYTWTMDMGFIDPTTYQNSNYFDFYKENMLGLTPTDFEDTSTQARQFLYQFINSAQLAGNDLTESYAFTGGKYFYIGGDKDAYTALTCTNTYGQ